MADDMLGMAASMQCVECFCSSAHSAVIAKALAGTAGKPHQAIFGLHAENGVSGMIVAAKGSEARSRYTPTYAFTSMCCQQFVQYSQ